MQNKIKRIGIFIETLSEMGGAEKAALLIAKYLNDNGFDLNIIVIDDGNSFFEVPKGCKIIGLNINKKSNNYFAGLINNIERISVIKSSISNLRLQTLISFTTKPNVLAIISCIGTPTKCIINQQSPSLISLKYLTQSKFRTFIWVSLSKIFYRYADNLVCVSNFISDSIIWVNDNNKRIIYNPLSNTSFESELEPAIELPKGYIYIVGMGRIIKQKGFDLLIKSFSLLEKNNPKLRLVIIGDGNQLNNLKDYSHSLGIADKIIFHGNITNPFPVLKQCQIFVLSSRWEAFGNVIIEAMSLSLPVICFDIPGGPREIIDHKVNGLLVKSGNIEALAKGIDKLICDKILRKSIELESLKVAETYSLARIGEKWHELLSD